MMQLILLGYIKNDIARFVILLLLFGGVHSSYPET